MNLYQDQNIILHNKYKIFIYMKWILYLMMMYKYHLFHKEVKMDYIIV